MQIRILDEAQVRSVYRQHMERDFPPAELRSLRNIEALTQRGEYRSLGLFDGEALLGYAMLICHGRDLLIDYFAIAEDRRGQGLGSALIRQVTAFDPAAASLIAEIDDPDEARDEAERTVRLRRWDFYSRNGFRDTGARVRTFGVWYRLIEFGDTKHTAEEIRQIYEAHYRQLLPKAVYEKQIRF